MPAKRKRKRDDLLTIDLDIEQSHFDQNIGQWGAFTPIDTITVPTPHPGSIDFWAGGEYVFGPDFEDENGGELGAFKEVTNIKTTARVRCEGAGPIRHTLAGAVGLPNPSYYANRVPAWRILEYLPAIYHESYLPEFLPVVEHGGPPPLYPTEKQLLLFGHSSLTHDVYINPDVFDQNFSAWYLIVDLLDLKKLIKSFLGRSSNLSRLRALAEKDLDATAKQLADDHLAVQFGVIPTVADIQGLATLLKKWKLIYDARNEILHKRYTWRRETPRDVEKEVLPLPAEYRFSVLVDGLFPVTLHAKDVLSLKHCRSLQYFFTCPEFQGFTARLRQFIDVLGVFDPAALWDVIPFSFVMDWVYHIGNWLHRNRPVLFPAEVWVSQYMESIKITTKRRWEMTWNEPLLGITIPTGDLPYKVSFLDDIMSFETTAYLRRRFQPPPVETKLRSPRPGSMLNLTRIAISASLANQRLTRTSRKERTRWL
jgi:hypothetical protein